MARFRFKAATAAGDVLEGEVEAASRGSALEQLRRKGQLPIRVEPLIGTAASRPIRTTGRRTNRLPPREVTLLTRELATLLKAGLPDRPGCFLCHRPTFDPDKRAVPWARAVAGGAQVLICPDCQHDCPDWQESLDRCEACGSTRLSVTLGDVVCRACGHADGGGAGA